jgi:hypothetical protein
VRVAIAALLCAGAAAGAEAGAGAGAGATAGAGAGAAAGVLARADAADLHLRTEETCAEADLSALREAIGALEGGESRPAPARWIFPVRGIEVARSIGGRRGDGYRPTQPQRCFAIANPGHPAHDLFVTDPRGDGRPEAPWVVQAVEEGPVLVARRGWKPGDSLKGGDYVVQYLPSRRQVAYYAHLGSVAVRAGQRLAAGEAIGTVGRTGRNAWPRRSPTHLHFALWDARTFAPVDPYRLLTGSSVTPPTPAPPAARQTGAGAAGR